MKPLVSIVIPTFNSQKTLRRTLNSLKNQTYKNTELIVADGFSKDKTIDIAKQFGAKVIYAQELVEARFLGMKSAKGKYIFAFDSDQMIKRTIIEKCVKKMEDKMLDALILNEKSVVRKGKLIERLLSYDKEIVSNSKDAHPLYGAVIPRFFNREKLLKLRWPKHVSILDDAILFHKNKTKLKIDFLEGDGIYHNEVDSWKVFFRKFKRYGLLYIPTMKASSKTTLAHSFPRRAYFKSNVIKKPEMLFGVLLLYTAKACAVSIGIGEYLITEIVRVPKKSKYLL